MARVTESALIKRINRKLAIDGEKLHKAGDENGNLGRYRIVHERTNSYTSWCVDLEALAVELGVLQDGEEVDYGLD